MKAFKKNIAELRDQAVGKLYGSVGNGYRRTQERFAEFMRKRTSGLSKRSLLVGLFLFIAVSVLYNGWVLIGSPSTAEVKFGSIKVPIETEKPRIITDAYNVELKKVKRFRKFMDSLYRSPGGRPVYDSIMIARPGLLDSARAIEKLIGRE